MLVIDQKRTEVDPEIDTNVQVNSIKSINGNCMELITPDGTNDGCENWYIGAPSTGLSFIAKNPAIVAVAGLVVAGLVAVFAKKRSASRR